MEKNETEVINSTNDTEETVNPEETEGETEVDTETESEVDVEALKKENATLKAQKDHWKKKANEKKELPKAEKGETVARSSTSLSPEDTIAIVRNNVHEDDIREVAEYANFKKITLSEALKTPVVKTLLAEKEENRRVAEATNTGGSRRTSAKNSEENLLVKASKGELPSSDEDMRKLVSARLNLSKK